MKLSSCPGSSHRKSAFEKGFSLVSAIFLLVVLAGLGAAMVVISTTHHQSSSLDVQGTQAYQAARAGVEWGLYQRLRPPNACSGSAMNFSMPAGTSLSAFTVTVVCTPASNFGIATAVIRATACNIPTGGTCPNPTPNNIDYVQRIAEVRL